MQALHVRDGDAVAARMHAHFSGGLEAAG
jgi:hypothetical protein